MTTAGTAPESGGIVRALWSMAGPLRAQLIRGLVWKFVQSMFLGMPFGIVVWVIRELDGDGLSDGEAWVAVGGVAVALVGQVVFGYVAVRDSWLSSYQWVSDLRLKTLDLVRRLPMGFHISRQRGDTTSALTSDMQAVEVFVSQGLPTVAQALGLPVVVLVFLGVVDPVMAVAAAVSIVVSIPVFVLSNRGMSRLSIRRQDRQAAVASRMLEHLQGIQVLKAFNRTADGQRELRLSIGAFRDISMHMVYVLAPLLVLFGSVVMLGTPITIAVGAYRYFGGELSTAALLTFLVLVLNVYKPLLQLISVMEQLRIADASLTRINRVTNARVQPEPAETTAPQSAEVSFHNVHFSYTAGTPIINGVSFDVPARSMTAIVGPSGAGKTTLLQLVGRFWDVDFGVVRIGGVDVRDMTTDTLYEQLTVVFQDVYLFQGSIFDNIALARPDASRGEIEHAARLAQAHDFIAALPDGYDSLVGEGGTSLSGGERQRISIARAILKDAPVVLLDEATASIDPTNDKLIQRALAQLVADKTLIVVAHRLSTIQNADQILVITDGHVLERGSHADLLAGGGAYARLWAERERASGWRVTA